MKITIIGASAGVGFECVKLALERGHNVTTLSRSKINLPENQNLTTLTGSATNKDDLKKSIANAEAVLIALGTGKGTKSNGLYSGFAKLLIEVQKETGTLTGFGAGDSGAYNSFIMKIFFALILKEIYADKTVMEEMISASGLKWLIARPGLLKDKPLTEKYRVETTLFKGIGIGAVNRADVADFMIKQAENPTMLHKYCSISNK